MRRRNFVINRGACAAALVTVGAVGTACSPPSSPALDATRRDAVVAVDGAPGDAAVDAPTGAYRLTSSAWIEGGAIPVKHSCRGANVSPPLAWTPMAGQGYALVISDNNNALVHCVLWDIPAATQVLPENIAKVAEPPTPAGAKQALAYDNQTRGYLGPCPPNQHTYEFALYAVSALPLPGLTLQSNRAAVVAAVMANQTAVATLTGTFTP